MRIPSSRLAIVTLLLLPATLRADVTMPQMFGDHMVLQQDVKLPVWGWAEPGEEITVTFGKQTSKTKAGADGKWSVKLEPVPANSEPQILTVAGKNTLKFEDVVVGDVWVCSGQSNMEWAVGGSDGGKEAAQSAKFPMIRVFVAEKGLALEPKDRMVPVDEFVPKAKWQVCQTAPDGSWNWAWFSAVGFYFGREIHKTTGNPVGLIGTYWGGTPAQAWVSIDGLSKEPPFQEFLNDHKNRVAAFPQKEAEYPRLDAEYKEAKKKWDEEHGVPYQAAIKEWQAAVDLAKKEGKPEPARPQPSVQPPRQPERPSGTPHVPGTLFNAMVSPLIPYAIKGVIWYQGESNEHRAAEYATLFPRLIGDWREKWGQGDFPFLFTQLANYRGVPTEAGQPSNWAALRDSQRSTLSVPNTGMAVAIEIGDADDIHPRNKLDVGLRLAEAAKHVAYGQKNVYSGPVFESVKIERNRAVLTFSSIGGGLKIGRDGVPSKAELTGFVIAGEDKKWHWAKAVIEGDKIAVSSEEVKAPVAVRYGWADNPACNLYNKENLPASPFRTDSWPIP